MANAKQETGKSASFLRGVKSELKKVIWPTKEETIKYTAIVIASCLIISLVVYALDLIFANLLNLIV